MRLYIDQTRFILTEEGIDLSIPLVKGKDNVNAWYCDPVMIEPVIAGDFVGSIDAGAAVNFMNIKLNPHGNGTHTECVGHIAKERFTINQCLKEFHFFARLISVQPTEERNETYQKTDQIIKRATIENVVGDWTGEKALIIRTLKNPLSKRKFQYSGTNPPYFEKAAIECINEYGVNHLMVDLPSIDREEDGGEVIGHKTFWSYPENPQIQKTISELLFIPDELNDGTYLIQIQIMSIESDASPSKIVAHKIHKA